MSEKAARQPMTDGEREILFQIQQLQAKWIDTIEMCFQREFYHRERLVELREESPTIYRPSTAGNSISNDEIS
jgi:hypothetical protein